MLDAARDLYGLPPAEFTAARNTLAELLKGSGEADDALAAKAIGGLRRPKVSEFALNQVARHKPAHIRRFIDAVAAAQSAQSAAIAGDARALRQATSELRQANAAVVDAAVHLLIADDGNGEAQRDAIAAVLREFISGANGGPLVAGVIGSEAIVGPDEFFPGAPDPPKHRPHEPQGKPPGKPQANLSAVVQQPNVGRQPSASAQATAAAKRALSRAERTRLTAMLHTAEGAVGTATDALEAAQTELLARRAALKAARTAAADAAAELAQLTDRPE
jgi:hypothetical protein